MTGISVIFQKKKKKKILEFSVSYTYPEYSENAAVLIYNLFPQIKLFLTVRNPTHRAFSEYLRSLRNCEIPAQLKFEEAIKKYPFILERGRYRNVLSPYFELFPNKNICVLIFEDLKLLGYKDFLQPLFSFLGVSDEIILPVKKSPSGESGRKLKYPKLQSLLLNSKQLIDSSAKAMNLETNWQNFKEKHMKTYQAIRAKNTEKIQISRSTLVDLNDFYKDDIIWLSDITGRNLKEEWK